MLTACYSVCNYFMQRVKEMACIHIYIFCIVPPIFFVYTVMLFVLDKNIE